MSARPGARDRAAALRESWLAAWPQALALWTRFPRLSAPRLCADRKEAAAEGLSGSFAMIRFRDHAVVIDLSGIVKAGLEDYALEILAHEIGHHVLAPGDLHDGARMIARMRPGLPGCERQVPLVANLYTDLLINDRLHRTAGLRLADIYQRLASAQPSRLWVFYMRIFEALWRLPRGTLVTAEPDALLDLDAGLGARLVRAYARDWVAGAGRFAALCLPYVAESDGKGRDTLRRLLDTADAAQGAGADAVPLGLAGIEDEEADGILHPRLDPALGGFAPEDGGGAGDEGGAGRATGGKEPTRGHRSPIDFRELLNAVGVKLTESEVAVAYYRDLARPHLVPFPRRTVPLAADPMPEGLESWELGSPLDGVDWLESVLRSPRVVPGVTTVQRIFGSVEGTDRERRPLDLYLGVDCSGSMVNPRQQLSFPVLGGAILVLSALRAGAKVMVTLSGEPGEHVSTDGFTDRENDVLAVLTGYLGTGYTFGIPRLETAFPEPRRHPAHILLVTDADIFAMLDGDRQLKFTDGWSIAERALRAAGGGGTMVLHMRRGERAQEVRRLEQQGWAVHHVTDWAALLDFARAFARDAYESSL